MKRLIVAALTGLLVGGSGITSGAASDRPIAEKAGAARSCIPQSSLSNSIAEDDQTLRLEMRGGRVYRNRLPAPCPELRRYRLHSAALVFDVRGANICRGDSVRIVDLPGGGSIDLNGAIACQLGGFERLPDRSARPR